VYCKIVNKAEIEGGNRNVQQCRKCEELDAEEKSKKDEERSSRTRGKGIWLRQIKG
jgi:hypothetical protein